MEIARNNLRGDYECDGASCSGETESDVYQQLVSKLTEMIEKEGASCVHSAFLYALAGTVMHEKSESVQEALREFLDIASSLNERLAEKLATIDE